MLRSWQCTETGWGCGSSFQAAQEDEVIAQASKHAQDEHGVDPGEEGFLDKIRSMLGTNESDDTNIRGGTGNLGVAPPSSERATGS